MITVKYYTKYVLGTKRYYLVEDGPQFDPSVRAASAILALIGKKTVSETEMILCRELGIKFEKLPESEDENT